MHLKTSDASLVIGVVVFHRMIAIPSLFPSFPRDECTVVTCSAMARFSSSCACARRSLSCISSNLFCPHHQRIHKTTVSAYVQLHLCHAGILTAIILRLADVNGYDEYNCIYYIRCLHMCELQLEVMQPHAPQFPRAAPPAWRVFCDRL